MNRSCLFFILILTACGRSSTTPPETKHVGPTAPLRGRENNLNLTEQRTTPQLSLLGKTAVASEEPSTGGDTSTHTTIITAGQASRGTLEFAEKENKSSSSIHFPTGVRPKYLPQIRVTYASVQRMEPGLTLFNLIRWENNKPDTDFGAIVAIDHEGKLRWSYQAPHLIFIVRQLANGNLLYGYGNRTDGLIEIDLLGNIVRRWDAANLGRTVADNSIPVAVDSLHHDVYPIDSETFLALTTNLHEMQPYYDPSYHSRQRIPKANIIADQVIEIKTDGTIVHRWPLFDLLDPRRIGYGSLHNFWDSRGYEHVEGGTFDWSHSNSVTYDSTDNSIIISVRHQDAVIKIDRVTGELVWILGNPRNWKGKHARKLLKPIGRPHWPYHQHAVEMTPHGTLLMFDNGNYQAMPFSQKLPANENQSRVVEFRVNTGDMTVEQVWEYSGAKDDQFYSTFLSDADWLPSTGNVLITSGGEIRGEDGEQTDAVPGVRQWAEIFEVTHPNRDTKLDSEKIFEVIIEANSSEPNIGWSIYRSERIDDLFGTAGPSGETPESHSSDGECR